MNKGIKIILPVIMIAVLMGSLTTQAAYGVTVGNIFSYDVVESNWDVEVGTESSSGTGWEFMGVTRTLATPFDVEVTFVDPSGVDWEMQVGTDVDTGSNSPFDALGLLILLILPIVFTNNESMPFYQAEADLGPGITKLFFIDADEWSDFFYELAAEDPSTYYTEEDPGLDIVSMGGTFDNSSTIAVFEWHFDYSYVNATIDTNLSGTYVWQYAYDTTDGHMKGYYHKIDYSGIMVGVDFTYQIEQKVEEVGYNLPAVAGGPSGIPGFEWFIAIPIFALLGGMTIIRRKRK